MDHLERVVAAAQSACHYKSFMRELLAVSSARQISIVEIGAVGGDPILLLTTPRQKSPHLLVAAGFHGDEPGGCWGLLYFLWTTKDSTLASCSISFLPLVNPTGFRLGKRQNRWGEDPNRGFWHPEVLSGHLSREGAILLREEGLLISLATDGFLSLHEDVEVDKFYLYTFEQRDRPGPFSHALRSAEEEFFQPYPDGLFEGAHIEEGIAFCHCDGAFEDYLFHRGIRNTACTETPGSRELSLRVQANAAIVNAFVRFATGHR